ncbi:MAG: hypothetical protein QM784_39055 [Polyangiaceae bacterium]
MKTVIKRTFIGIGGGLALALIGVAGYAYRQIRDYDASMAVEYAPELPKITASTDPAVISRGKHLAQSVAGCASRDCHGSDLAGGRRVSLGPVGTIAGPNITAGGIGAVYSDTDLVRLIRFGVKKDGRSVRMMPVQDFSWLPDDDLTTLVSYLKSAPSSDKGSGATEVGVLGKVLDRQGKFVWDVARHVKNLPPDKPRAVEPNRNYGRYVVRLCTGCHGEHLSGGPIPGAPPSLPTPANITMHETGIRAYTFEDFTRLMKTGVRKDGRVLDPFMAIDLTKNFDDVELRALWDELTSRPPRKFGER